MSDLPDELSDLCRRLAAEAAAVIRATGTRQGIRPKSGATDLVSEADERASELIRAMLLDKRPEDAQLCEEAGSVPGSSQILWIVDPLDGSENFVRGSSRFAVSIAAFTSTDCLAAVIHEPATDDAEDLASIRVAAALLPPGRRASTVAVGIPHDAGGRQLARSMIEHLSTDLQVDRTGAAACDLLRVARGEVGAHVSVGLPAWDVAAGQELVRASGGVVIDVRTARGGVLAIAGDPALAYQLAIRLNEYTGRDGQTAVRAAGGGSLLRACVPFSRTTGSSNQR